MDKHNCECSKSVCEDLKVGRMIRNKKSGLIRYENETIKQCSFIIDRVYLILYFEKDITSK